MYRHGLSAVVIRIGLPVKYAGVGKQLDDLELFDPDSFVEEQFDL